MTPLEAARLFERAAKRLPGEIQAAESRSLLALKAAAERRSQGPLQTADLVRMAHPYARRRLRLNPDIINKWTGEFLAGWRTDPPRLVGGEVRSSLFNVTLKARGLEQGLVFGRPVMAPRSPHLAAFSDIRAERERRLESVWELIFR